MFPSILTNENDSRQFLHEHQDIAREFATYAEFCQAYPQFGAYWIRSGWMRQLWNFNKLRGFLLQHPIMFPDITSIKQVFTEAELFTTPTKPVRKTTQSKGWFNVHERYDDWLKHSRYHRTISGTIGGMLGWNTQHNCPQRWGGAFYHCRAKTDPALGDPKDWIITGNDSRETPYFELIEWEKHTLLTLTSNLIIASRWIAVLDPGESLFDLLPVDQQQFLLSEWTTRLLEVGEW